MNCKRLDINLLKNLVDDSWYLRIPKLFLNFQHLSQWLNVSMNSDQNVRCDIDARTFRTNRGLFQQLNFCRWRNKHDGDNPNGNIQTENKLFLKRRFGGCGHGFSGSDGFGGFDGLGGFSGFDLLGGFDGFEGLGRFSGFIYLFIYLSILYLPLTVYKTSRLKSTIKLYSSTNN